MAMQAAPDREYELAVNRAYATRGHSIMKALKPVLTTDMGPGVVEAMETFNAEGERIDGRFRDQLGDARDALVVRREQQVAARQAEQVQAAAVYAAEDDDDDF